LTTTGRDLCDGGRVLTLRSLAAELAASLGELVH